MSVAPANIPRELRDRPQWVVWRTETRGSKPTKVPYSVSGGHAKANDPATWATFAEAVNAAGNGYDGVGYVFSPDDPYCGIDLDDVRDAETGELHEAAREIIDTLDSYSEISPSREGIKIIVKASKPGDRFRTGKTPWHGDIELYDRERYFTITGSMIDADRRSGALAIREAQDELDAVYATYFPDSSTEERSAAPVDGHRPSEEDEEVLERALDRRHFRTLWNGDTKNYPSGSEADLAFCTTLAQITGDRDQVLRLWQASKLWRAKCDDRPDYVASTIDKAFTDVRPDFAALHLLNDTGNAKRFVAEHGHEFRYAEAFGWLWWDGARWKPDATGAAERAAKASAIRMFEAIPKMDQLGDEFKKKLKAFANSSMMQHKIEATLRSAKSEKEVVVEGENFDRQPYRLNVLNGTLDLRTGEMTEHNRNDLITKLAPVEYDPEARSELWDRFIERILPDEEVRAFVQRCSGYSCAGDPTEKVLMFCHGPNDTGKSKFLEAISSTLGDYAQTADFETFLAKKGGHGVRNDIAKMRGARLIKSLEVDEGERLAAAVVKAMTGGDTISARFLYKEFIEFKMEGVLWLAANARPKVDANDVAMWRRILHVPYTVVIPREEQDTKLGDKLAAPDVQRAILAWLVEGFREYLRVGISVPTTVVKYTEEYRHEQNPLADFFETRAETGVEGTWLPWQDVKDMVQRWADDERLMMPTDPEIRNALKAAGCKDERRRVEGKVTRGYARIRERRDVT